MNKEQLITRVYKDTKFRRIPKIAIEQVIQSTFALIHQSVEEDGKFSYPGFGTFLLRTRKARKGRNPQSGEDLWIESQKTMSFRPSAKLKSQLK